MVLRDDLLRFVDPSKGHREIKAHWGALLRALVSQHGAWAVADYRFRRWGRSTRARALFTGIGFFTRRIVEAITGISLATDAQFGPGLYIGHFGGIIISGRVVAGEDCNLSQGVTIGAHRGGTPRLGNRVYVAPGAKVFGAITIGDDAQIGANAVVTKDVPAGATVIGIPAAVRVDGQPSDA